VCERGRREEREEEGGFKRDAAPLIESRGQNRRRVRIKSVIYPANVSQGREP
jgi:hypothetical protein